MMRWVLLFDMLAYVFILYLWSHDNFLQFKRVGELFYEHSTTSHLTDRNAFISDMSQLIDTATKDVLTLSKVKLLSNHNHKQKLTTTDTPRHVQACSDILRYAQASPYILRHA